MEPEDHPRRDPEILTDGHPVRRRTVVARSLPLSALAAVVDDGNCSVVSTDLFDTILLRDHTTETTRLEMACERAALRLGADPAALTRLRWLFHDAAYRAVSMERPAGDASLRAICAAIATAVGRGPDDAESLREAEVEVDSEHLSPALPLLGLLGRATQTGLRVIAVSDTYYETNDLRRILGAVVGAHPFAAIYSSADVGLTKHSGRLFHEVARREQTSPERIVHVGDHPDSDVRMAQASGWQAVHVPRGRRHRAEKLVGGALGLPGRLRRNR